MLAYYIGRIYSGEMKPPLNFLAIVAENGGRGHTEMIVWSAHSGEYRWNRYMAVIPAQGRITRDKELYNDYSLLLFWCPYMVITVSVQCNGGLLPDIILLTLCDSIGEPF